MYCNSSSASPNYSFSCWNEGPPLAAGLQGGAACRNFIYQWQGPTVRALGAFVSVLVFREIFSPPVNRRRSKVVLFCALSGKETDLGSARHVEPQRERFQQIGMLGGKCKVYTGLKFFLFLPLLCFFFFQFFSAHAPFLVYVYFLSVAAPASMGMDYCTLTLEPTNSSPRIFLFYSGSLNFLLLFQNV